MRLASALVTAGLFAARAGHAQVADTTAADSTAFALPPIEVVGTIRPDAGPTVGSGIPARVTTLGAEDVDAYEPRVLSDAVRQVPGFSTYDDLGSPYKLNISSRGFYSSPVVGLPQGVAVFLDVDWTATGWRGLAIAVLGTAGLAVVGTLLAGMSLGVRFREFLLPVLLFPLVLPVLVIASRLTADALAGLPSPDRWWGTLALFDWAFALVGYFVFDYVLED